MRVCIEKSSGKVLEMQSHATEGTLVTNAVAMGYAAAAVEERVVTQEEYDALIAPKYESTLDMGGDINETIGR